MQIDFNKAARMDDLLDVVTSPLDVKGASAILVQSIERSGEALVEAKVRIAFVSDGRARPLPEPLRQAMLAHVGAAAAAARDASVAGR